MLHDKNGRQKVLVVHEARWKFLLFSGTLCNFILTMRSAMLHVIRNALLLLLEVKLVLLECTSVEEIHHDPVFKLSWHCLQGNLQPTCTWSKIEGPAR